MTKASTTSLEERLRQLGLGHAAARLGELLTPPGAERISHEDLLGRLLDHELACRETDRLDKARRRASFPFLRTIEDFELPSRPRCACNCSAATWAPVSEGRNLIMCGPSGTGKTQLAVALTVHPVHGEPRMRTPGPDGPAGR